MNVFNKKFLKTLSPSWKESFKKLGERIELLIEEDPGEITKITIDLLTDIFDLTIEHPFFSIELDRLIAKYKI